MADVSDYTGLITSEHSIRPNFIAALEALLKPFVEQQNMLNSLPGLFDVDVAVGQQLDFVGEWVGLSRGLRAPISGVYFALDTAGVGFDEGFLFGIGDPTEGVIQLDDVTYRLMIYAKIAANIWNGTFQQAEEILSDVFVSSPGTHIFIQDNSDMSMDFGITGVLPNALFQSLIESGYLEVRPAGVRLNSVSVSAGPLFGFDTSNYNLDGPDFGSFV